jgi:predicted nucleotidyltransferase
MSDEPSISYLEDMLQVLTSHQVQFVVAGGVAAVLHGVERTTMDLDIALEMSKSNVERFGKAASELGLQPLVPVPVDALADPEAVRMMVEEKNAIVFMLADPGMPLRKVDVFLTPGLSYENLVTDAVLVNLPGVALRVVSAERLIALKRAVVPPRDKDLFDIRALERLVRERQADE